MPGWHPAAQSVPHASCRQPATSRFNRSDQLLPRSALVPAIASRALLLVRTGRAGPGSVRSLQRTAPRLGRMAAMGLAVLGTASQARLPLFLRGANLSRLTQQPLCSPRPSANRQVCCQPRTGRCYAALEADFGQPNEAFSAFEGSLGEGSFGEGCEVNPDAQRQRQRQSSQEQPISARLQAAAQAILSAAKRAQQLARQFALHLAKAVVLGVAVRLALRRSQLKRQQTLQKQAQQKYAAQAAVSEAAAAKKAQAQARMARAEKRRSQADRAYTDMLLQQDNPDRTLDSKWRDLTTHMRSKRCPEFRRRAAGLFSAALDASHAVHLAIDTEAAKGTQALDRLVAKHDCVAEEEALRSHIFISLLNAEQS